MATTASQQYDVWIQAVAAALKSSGRGLTVNQIDPNQAHAAFIQGVSPVVFARQAQAMPPRPRLIPRAATLVMKPNTTVIRFSCIFLSIAGWIFWAIGAIALLFAVWALFATAFAGAGAATSSDSNTRDSSVFIGVLGISIAVYQAFVALCIFIMGAVWHWLAQQLSMSFHQYDHTRRTLP